MKLCIICLFSAFSSLALAQPYPPVEWYIIRTKAEVNTLSNLYLSVRDGKIAAFAGRRENASVAQRFFTTPYPAAGTLSIHAGDRTHQFGLSGPLGSGLLRPVDLVNPTGETIRPDHPVMWSVFTIEQGGVIRIKDGAENTLRDRTWVAWLETDGTYYVGFWDGVTPQPRTTANVTLIAERTEAPPDE